MLVGAAVSGARLAAEKNPKTEEYVRRGIYLGSLVCFALTVSMLAQEMLLLVNQVTQLWNHRFGTNLGAVSGGRQCMDKIRAYVGTSGGTAGFLCCCADPTEKAVGSVPAFHARTGSGKRTERQNDVAGSLCASACRGENLPIL